MVHEEAETDRLVDERKVVYKHLVLKRVVKMIRKPGASGLRKSAVKLKHLRRVGQADGARGPIRGTGQTLKGREKRVHSEIGGNDNLGVLNNVAVVELLVDETELLVG